MGWICNRWRTMTNLIFLISTLNRIWAWTKTLLMRRITWMWLMTISSTPSTHQSRIGWFLWSIWTPGLGRSTGCLTKTLRERQSKWPWSIRRGCCRDSSMPLSFIMRPSKAWRDGWKWATCARKEAEGRPKTRRWRKVFISGINTLKSRTLSSRPGWSKTKPFSSLSAETL